MPDAEIWSFLKGYENELVLGSWKRKVYVNDEEVVSMAFDVVRPDVLTPASAPGAVTGPRLLLGIQYEDLPENVAQEIGRKTGAYVNAVFAGTPADRAGVLTGDVVIQFDQTPVSSRDELRRLIRQSAGKTVSLLVLRGKDRLKLGVRLMD